MTNETESSTKAHASGHPHIVAALLVIATLVTFLAIGLLQSIHVQAQLASRDSRAPTPLLR